MTERTILTPIGEMCLTEENGSITSFLWRGGRRDETPLLLEAERQIAEYFEGERKRFDLPLAPEGTVFQKSVWAALIDIPYGEVRSYADIAKAVGKEKACRAVGMANHRNPIPVIIPCHRVIGADGTLTGYAGGLEKKRLLLTLEKEHR